MRSNRCEDSSTPAPPPLRMTNRWTGVVPIVFAVRPAAPSVGEGLDPPTPHRPPQCRINAPAFPNRCHCEEGKARRGNPPVECGETGSLATDPLRRIHLSFTENPTWKQEIATGINALAMTRKWGSRQQRSGRSVFGRLNLRSRRAGLCVRICGQSGENDKVAVQLCKPTNFKK